MWPHSMHLCEAILWPDVEDRPYFLPLHIFNLKGRVSPQIRKITHKNVPLALTRGAGGIYDSLNVAVVQLKMAGN